MFTGIGAAFAVSSFAYDIGTPLAMGPAAFPLGVAVVLIVLGVAVIVRAVVAPSREETFVEEPASEEQLAEDSTLDKLAAAKASQAEGVPFVTRPVPVVGDVEQGPPLGFGRIPWRPLLIVTATILFFTVCVEGLGLVLTSFIAVVGVSFARVETTWKQALLTGVVMAALSWVVFILLLRLNVDAIGPWIGG